MRELKAYEITHKDGGISFVSAYNLIQATQVCAYVVGEDDLVGAKPADENRILSYAFNYSHSVDVDDSGEPMDRGCLEYAIEYYGRQRKYREFVEACEEALEEVQHIESLTVGDLMRQSDGPAYLSDEHTFKGERHFDIVEEYPIEEAVADAA